MKNLDKKAFTLIELLVVIAVLAILVLLATPRFLGHTEKAKLRRIQHDVKVMEQKVGAELTNNDDDFDNWEDNNKDLSQLIKEGKLFEKEGPVTDKVEPTDKPYKVIPEKYKDKINTKLKGTFYANNGGKVYYEHEKPLVGIPTVPGDTETELEYSDEEIDDLVKEGIDFIPVATAEELNNVRRDEKLTYGAGTQWEGLYTGGLDKKYVQVKDIDLSEYSEEGWNPIGPGPTTLERFTGTYDGGNYVITGLVVNGAGNDYQGLFGRTEGATIRNVRLIDNTVTGSKYVGGLMGIAINSIVENSYATGSVEGSGQVGGLMGQSVSSEISNSYATGTVESTGGYAGGFVGYAGYDTTISNSYATGEVTGSGDLVGGFVGGTISNTNISNSYATGSVSSSGNLVGGFVGRADDSTISNSYATGSATGTTNVGGFTGFAAGSMISNSYATGEVGGSENSIGGVGGFVGMATGSIMKDSYAIGSATGTNNVGGFVGSATSSITISNSYATGSATGSRFVGGFVGYDIGSNISESYATGEVEGSDDVGGFVGQAMSGTEISNSYATGSVTGTNRVGGLVGSANGATISNFYAIGSVTGTGINIGGFAGQPISITTSNSYWNTDTTAQPSPSGRAEGKTTEDMMKQATYSGWDFDEVWSIKEGESYPYFKHAEPK